MDQPIRVNLLSDYIARQRSLSAIAYWGVEGINHRLENDFIAALFARN